MSKNTKPLASILSEPKPEEQELLPSACSRCGGRDPKCYICGIPDAFTNHAGAVLQKAREVVTLWQGRVHQREIDEQAIKISKAVEELSVLVDGYSVADRVSSKTSSVGSTATGVSDEEIAEEAGREIMACIVPATANDVASTEWTQRIILTAIRKAKSLSEPKESEEEKQSLGEPGAI